MDKPIVPIIRIDRENGQALKGLAIFLVLLGHTGYIDWGGATGVTLFLIISGYGLECSFQEQGLRHFWSRRIQKVWVPYVIVAVFNILSERMSDAKIIACTVIGLDFNLNLDPTMWYISFLFYWYMVFYLVSQGCTCVKNKKLRQTIKLVMMVVFGYFARRLFYTSTIWHWTSVAGLYALAFPIGVALANLREVEVTQRAKKWLWMTILFFTAAYLWGAYGKSYHLFKTVCLGLLCISTFQLTPPQGKLKKLLLWAGTYSYSMYLFEGRILGRRDVFFVMFHSEQLKDLAYILATIVLAVVFWDGIYNNIVNKNLENPEVISPE